MWYLFAQNASYMQFEVKSKWKVQEKSSFSVNESHFIDATYTWLTEIEKLVLWHLKDRVLSSICWCWSEFKKFFRVLPSFHKCHFCSKRFLYAIWGQKWCLICPKANLSMSILEVTVQPIWVNIIVAKQINSLWMI